MNDKANDEQESDQMNSLPSNAIAGSRISDRHLICVIGDEASHLGLPMMMIIVMMMMTLSIILSLPLFRTQ